MTPERAALIELLAVKELQAKHLRHKQRRACSRFFGDPQKIAEVDAMKAELDTRMPAAWARAKALVSGASE